jgi:hypothetical protein
LLFDFDLLRSHHMKRTGIYKKVGRRYIEIGEYDPERMDYIPNGCTMTVKRPGMESTRYGVDPDIVPLLAAAVYCEDKISEAIRKATEVRPTNQNITPEQRAAFDAFLATMDPEDPTRNMMTLSSARDAAEAGTRALILEAQKLLTNESVKQAYEHFLLLCKLSATEQQIKP